MNQEDGITIVVLANDETERLLGGPRPIDHLTDPGTGTGTGTVVFITLVTDNSGPFRACHVGEFIATGPRFRTCATGWNPPRTTASARGRPDR